MIPKYAVAPLIVASALFMENIDSTVIATSLPAIAADLKEDPIALKLALTSYLLSLAVFIPVSGWMADRFGARTVFRAAIVVFTLGSIACGFSQSLLDFVLFRMVQGLGGAMMVPVGRLVIVRTVPKHELVSALAWLMVPALMGPLIGPPLGGFITTYFHWRWIFWINIPIGIIGVLLATRFIENFREAHPPPLDLRGFVLLGLGLAGIAFGLTTIGQGLLPLSVAVLMLLVGSTLVYSYVLHARKKRTPVLDLKLLSVPTFRASIIGGSLFRVGIGAMVFLLPLLFQLGFGLTAFASGALTFAGAIGAIADASDRGADSAPLRHQARGRLQRGDRGRADRRLRAVRAGSVAPLHHRDAPGRRLLPLAAVHQHEFAGLCRSRDALHEPSHELHQRGAAALDLGRRHGGRAHPRDAALQPRR